MGKYKRKEGKLMEEKKENCATDVLGTLVKQLKTMWIAIFILIVLLVGTNMAWLYVFQSYDYVTQDGSGYNYYNSRVQGDVFNGAEGTGEEIGEVEGN